MFIAVILAVSANAQPKTDTLLKQLLLKGKGDLVTEVLGKADAYRLQIIYTQIDRTKTNKPVFKNY